MEDKLARLRELREKAKDNPLLSKTTKESIEKDYRDAVTQAKGKEKEQAQTGLLDQFMDPGTAGAKKPAWKPRKPKEGKEWVVRYPAHEVSFTSEIPVYSKYHPIGDQLFHYFKHRVTDVSLFIIVDVPGAGKTATVVHAVGQVVGAGYMRVRASEVNGALHSLKAAAARKCKGWSSKGTVLTRENIQKKLDPLCRASLYRLFQLYSEKVQKTKDPMVGNLNGNQVPKWNKEVDLSKELEKIISQTIPVLEPDELTPFIFHIDEAQAWAVPANFKRSIQTGLVSERDREHYAFIVLTQVLNELLTNVPRFRVVITGTDYIIGGTLQFASGLRSTFKVIQPMPPTTARHLCDQFFDLSALDQSPETQRQLADIIEQVSYNPRALQYFMDDAATHLMDVTTAETDKTLGRLRDAVEHAFALWEKGLEDKLGDKDSEEGELFKTFLALVFIYPDRFGAKSISPSPEGAGIMLSPDRVEGMTGQILAQHNAGALRARSDMASGQLTLLEPSGFIARHLFGARRLTVAANANIRMVRHWITQTEEEGVGSSGHLFERLVAAEFAIPTSPLYRRLFRALQDETLLPEPRVVLKEVLETKMIDPNNLNKDQIACIVDSNEVHERKLDLTLPLFGGKMVGFELKNDSKGSRVLNSALKFFKFMERGIDSGKVTYAVVLSVHKLPTKTKHCAQLKAWLDRKREDGTHPYVILADTLGEKFFDECFFPISDLLSAECPGVAKAIAQQEQEVIAGHPLKTPVPYPILDVRPSLRHTESSPNLHPPTLEVEHGEIKKPSEQKVSPNRNVSYRPRELPIQRPKSALRFYQEARRSTLQKESLDRKAKECDQLAKLEWDLLDPAAREQYVALAEKDTERHKQESTEAMDSDTNTTNVGTKRKGGIIKKQRRQKKIRGEQSEKKKKKSTEKEIGGTEVKNDAEETKKKKRGQKEKET